jgi:toxin ParE1/3/4
MPSFQISPEASRDLNEIIDYFLVSSLDAGDRFIAAFNQKCLYLTQFPNIGKRYPNLHPSIRGISFNQYIIFYQPLVDGIIISRVVSGHRDLSKLFRQTE